MPLADLAGQLRTLLQRRGGILPPPLGNRLDRLRRSPCSACWRCSWPVPGPGATCCGPPIRTSRSPSCRSPPPTWPGPGSTRSSPPTPATSTKVFLVKRQIPDSSYPAVTSSFLVQTVFDTIGRRSSSSSTRSPRGCCRRCRRSPTCPPSRSPSGPTTRSVFFITVGVTAAGDRDRHLPARPPRAPLLGPGPAGPRHPHRAAPLPARGLRLAGDRLALPLRRLLVLPRGLRDRRLGRQRDAGDERARRSPTSSPSPPAAPAPSRRCWSRPCTGPTRTAVLSFSVGTQIAMAAWSVVLGFAAILLVFRTTDWRGLIRQAQDEAESEKAARGGQPPSSTSRDSGRRRATARAGARRRGTRSGCGRGGSRAGPGRGRRSSRTSMPAAASTSAWVGAAGEPFPAEASGGRASRRPRPSRRSARRSTSSVKAVVRRPEAVRWGPAATAQLSRRQRRKSTGTSGRPEGPGSAAGAGARARASRASGQP